MDAFWCRFLTRVARPSGAGSMIFTFSMYPAFRALDNEVPAFSRNRRFFFVYGQGNVGIEIEAKFC